LITTAFLSDAEMTTTYHHSDNAEKYRSNASFVFNDENTKEVLKLLDPQPGEVILDVGCGE
jgi:ubiquinone/menaquinone biosynthesis C-methylase UbiE